MPLMELLSNESRSSWPAITASVVTIGNFDGLHLGHRALIAKVRSLAVGDELATIAYTFDPHPARVLAPQRPFHSLFTVNDLKEQLQGLVDYLVVEPFTAEFAKISASAFLQNSLLQQLNMKHLVVGYDFKFGAQQEGDLNWLKQQAVQLGFEVHVVGPIQYEGEVISSTRVRSAVQLGQMSLVRELLQRPFYLEGQIVKGAQRGRSIGIPTANLHSESEIMPAKGVYVGFVEIVGESAGSTQHHQAVINIGTNPTFTGEGSPVKVEAHIIQAGEYVLYGKRLRFHLLQRLREEKRFSSVEDLVAQIRLDIEQAEGYLLTYDQMG